MAGSGQPAPGIRRTVRPSAWRRRAVSRRDFGWARPRSPTHGEWCSCSPGDGRSTPRRCRPRGCGAVC